MKESRIYNLRMAEYLIDNGFRYIRVVQDMKNPRFYNWIFEDTPELHNAIHKYINK